jgi:bifunctional UDP-N-acetylglucosamine pyrophosphorylase/glucosamine-1-phosphate N-acetyltransferase
LTLPLVLVLAGGASNRFWPLRDKLFVEFGAMSLLERHLRALKDAGFERFVVISSLDAQERIDRLAPAIGLRELYVVLQAEPRGMADAVLCARSEIQAMGAHGVYITQAHDVIDPAFHKDIAARWQKLILREPQDERSVSGLIAAARTQRYFPGGYLTLDGERVTGVIEKPGAGNEPSDLVNLVAHVFADGRALLSALDAESAVPGADDAYERAVSKLMQAGVFHAAVYEGRWQGLKYPWHLLDVTELLLERWTSGAESPGPDYEQREDGVFVGRDVRIFPGAYVVAPALLGHGVVVGHNSLIRGSLIGPRCVVGFGSEVARSYLAEGVELHHNYVGDSVMDRESAMGYGAVTANFRIDGKTVPMRAGNERIDTGRMKLGAIIGAGVRIGVNTSTMPGVKIGAGAIVGPNLSVSRDLEDGARFLRERTNWT